MKSDHGARNCPGCGGKYPDVPGGPVHRYLESSPGCWAIYGEILALEYNHPAYFAEHKLTVDAYAVQHPGQPSPQSIQSVAVHLIRLCLILERGASFAYATATMQQAARTKGEFHWLTPPASRGAIIAANVHGAASPDEHIERVRAWAQCAWQAWAEHHETIRQWVPR